MKKYADRLIQNRREFRSSRSSPCPECGNMSGYCLVSPEACLCPRADSGVKRYGEYGWLHVTDSTSPVPNTVAKPERHLSDDEMAEKWTWVAHDLRAKAGTHIARLGEVLGVCCGSLMQLGVGYGNCCGRLCWTFPMRNDRGQVVGISRRLEKTGPDGQGKMAARGSRAGLFFEDNWWHRPGPVLIVEGGSDVAACLTLDLCAVGRPSNVGGIGYLAKLLVTAKNKRIVVIGERDQKAHESLVPVVKERHDPQCRGCSHCFPGKHGAVLTAKALAKRLGRAVAWSMPPDGAKDSRAWLVAQGGFVGREDELRSKFLRGLGR